MTATLPHRVARLDFTASVADLGLAFGLRPRLERLAWELMPAAMERVFDAAGAPDRHLRIDRLELDLGAVRPDHLEEDALGALQRALSEALGEALHAARYHPTGASRLIAPAAMRIEEFETYLVWGRLPPARAAAGFDAGDRLRTLIAEQPEALAAMLRRRAHDRQALERLLLQAGETGFRALLGLLAPADAAVILALLADTMLAHRERRIEMPPRLTEPALDRLLRLATLEFLLRDAGSQFNRRRFLAHLLRREAVALGVDYASLLQLLAAAVEAVRARTGFRSSLPKVLAELLAETGSEAVADEPAPGEPEADAIAAARAGSFDALVALVRRHAADRLALDALVRRLAPPLFAALIERLAATDAPRILEMLDELALVHRSEPLPGLDEPGFEPALRSLALLYLLGESGGRFDRRDFLGFLLKREAARARLDYAELVWLFSAALARLRPRSGLRSSLPGLLAELADELDGGGAAPGPSSSDDAGLGAALTAARGGDFEALLTLLRASANDRRFAALVADLPEPLFAGLVRRARPSAASTILSCLDALIVLHRESPLLMVSGATFAAMVRAAGLRLALADPARRFRRRTWLRRLIAELAERAGGSAKALRRALGEAIAAQTGAAGPGAALLAELIRAEQGETALAGLSDADLVLRALDSDAEAAAGALRAVAGDSVRLLQLAAGFDARERDRLLVALDRDHGAALAGHLRRLERLHAAAPLLTIDGAAFAQLLWTIAVGHLVGRRGAPFDRAALGRHLAEGIARFGGRRPHDLLDDLRESIDRLGPAEAEAARAVAAEFFGGRDVAFEPRRANDPMPAIERYLRTGQPPVAGRGLPALAASDRARLAATVRRLARAAPGQVAVLTDRLLAWLLPEELLECLSPGAGARAARWADAAGSVDASAWRAIVAAVLAGERPPFAALAGDASRRLDRIALLGHWLDHGTAAWWAPDDAAADALLAELPELTFAELDRLFGGADAERGFARLWGAVEALRPDLQRRLLERLAPWATRPGGALAATLGRLEPRRRLLALTRLAADALAGRDPDLARLAAPVAEPPVPLPPDAPSRPQPDIDSARLFAWLDGAPASAAEVEALVRHFALLADRDDAALAEYLAARRGQARARDRWASLLPPEALGRLVRLLLPSGAQAWLDAAALFAAAARHDAPFGAPRPDPARVWTVLLDLIAPGDAPPPAHGIKMLAERLADGDAQRAGRLRAQALRLAQQGGHVAVAAALRRADSAPAVSKPPPARPARGGDAAAVSDPAPADERPAEPGDAIFIDNAGLVLLNPYLPTLFARLDLLTDTEKGPRVVGIEAMSRGVHLLQYIADGSCDRPEPLLVLNKLLCGLPTAQPIEPWIEPSDADRVTCDGLIAAIIAGWPSIANSSPAALRETFFRREGRLQRCGEGWRLRVQRRTLDVLVDRIPWSFALVCHRWMTDPVHVEW